MRSRKPEDFPSGRSIVCAQTSLEDRALYSRTGNKTSNNRNEHLKVKIGTFYFIYELSSHI